MTASPKYKCCEISSTASSYLIEGTILYLYGPGGVLQKVADLSTNKVTLQGDYIVIGSGLSAFTIPATNTVVDQLSGDVGLSFETLQRSTSMIDPAGGAFDITPNDGANLSRATRSIYVGGDGDMQLTTVWGDTVTFVGLLAGQVLPVRAIKVFSTSTTATNIVGLY